MTDSRHAPGTPGTPNTTGAVILAGGLSRRFGENKALLRAKEGGPVLIEMVRDRLLAAGFQPPVLVTNAPAEYAFLGLRTVGDASPGTGPLVGILAGLEHSGYPKVLVVACDMPLLNPALLRYMSTLPGEYDAVVPRWTGSDGKVRVEPLHAIYATGCIEVIRGQLAAGDYRSHALFPSISVRYLEEEEIRDFDPQLTSFHNINTAQEWEEIRASLAG